MRIRKWTVKTFSIRLLKLTGWLVFSLLLLLLVLIVAVQIPSVQSAIVQKTISLAEDKLGTKISVASITIGFPKSILIKQLYIQDLKKDTLLYAGSIDISTDLWGLLHHSIQLNSVKATRLRAHIERRETDSLYNYDFILQRFATPTATPIDTAAASWTFSISSVALNDTQLHFHDFQSGNHFDASVSGVALEMEQVDLDKNIFSIKHLTLAQVNAKILQTKIPKPSPAASPGFSVDLGVKTIRVAGFRLLYNQQALGQVIDANIGELALDANKVDLKNNNFDIEKFKITNSWLSYQQMADGATTSPSSGLASVGPVLPWHLSLNEFVSSGNTIQYYDFTKPVSNASADYSHVWLQQITGKVTAVQLSQNNYEAVLENFSVSEKKGFQIKEATGAIKVGERNASLENFRIRSAKSYISLSAHAGYSSLSTIATSWKNMSTDLRIRPSVVSLHEVSYFLPEFPGSIPVKIPIASTIHFEGTAKGGIDDLTVEHFKIHAFEKTFAQASGRVQHISDLARAEIDLTVDSLFTTKADVLATVPDTLLPKSIQLPEWVNVKGTFHGFLRRPVLQAVISSDEGNVAIDGHADLDSGSVGSYEARATVSKLALGKIIRNDSIGSISLSTHVRGAGLNLKDVNAKVNLAVSEFYYNRYTYQNIKLDGLLQHNFFTGTAFAKDKNLDFELTASLDYRSETPAYKIKASLKSADLGALHVTFRPIRARGTLDVNLATSDFKVINGTIAVRNVAIFDGKQLYSVDSLLFASIDTKGQTDIKINSDIVAGSFQGTIHLLSLPDVLERHFNSYFSLQDTTHSAPVDNQDFKFTLELKKTDLITGILFPSLKSFQSRPMTGSFNSARRQLEIHAEVRKLQYDNLNIQDFKLDVSSTSRSLACSLNLNDFRYDSLKIPGMSFDTKVAHDSIKSTLVILDSLQKQKYVLGTVFNSLKDQFQFRFIPGKVLLNYNEWKVPDDNYIRFHQKTMRAHNFSIEHDQEKILIDTKEDQQETVTLGFRQFDLENIFNIVSGSKSIVAGKLDGDLNVFLKKNNAFNASVKIIDLNIMQRAWGDLSLTADRISDDKFDLTLAVNGEHSDILLKGNYVTTKPASLINVTADIKRIDMTLMEPFSRGQIKKSSGLITGQLSMTGTLARPSIKGAVHFNDVNFISSYVNSAFTLKNETLAFNGSELTFSNFRMLDDNNNAATLKGSILTKNFRDYTLNLDLSTKNFKILNTTAVNNDLYYGKVRLNATAKITGPLSLPVVDLKMSYSDDTEFTYVIPVASKGVTSQKGVVEFVDKHAPKDTFMMSVHVTDTVQNFIKGFDLTATLRLNDAQKFTIVIDPKSGDKLFVQGNTTLVVKIDASGNMDLSGQYEITKGSYSFSFYKLVRRDFEILKGGTITWSGDPFDATFDLQALYKVETSPLELLSNQTTDLSAAKQSFPFLVYLSIKGQISAPQISFRLDMPEGSKSVLGGNVYAALQDINTREPDLNKQVFSLLVLRRFMADDPFENQVSTSLSSNARSSVSGILTEQLNRLSHNIKGVQLTVDLKSFDDYTTGVPLNQTQLQLGVQKTLLHNKLVVKLAGNVDIAGENTNQNSLTDYIGDLALEYKVNPDGTLRLTGFRNSDYDMIDGELIKTGAGVIYVKDFNALKELFKPNAKDQ